MPNSWRSDLETMLAEPSPLAFERVCEGFATRRENGDPWHKGEQYAQKILETWDPLNRVVHDIGAWLICKQVGPWSALIHGVVFFDWGPYDDWFEAFADRTHLTGLRRLEVHKGDLTDAAARALGASPLLRNVETLVLDGIGMSQEGAILLAAHGNLSSVRVLDCSHNPIGAEGLSALLAHIPQGELRSLNATGIKLSGEGFVKILRERDFSKLRDLSLASNPIYRGGGVKALLAKPLSALEHLDVRLVWPFDDDDDIAQLFATAPLFQKANLQLKVWFNCNSTPNILALISSPNLTLQAEGRDSIERCTVKQLKAVAKQFGIVGYSRLKKTDLLERIITVAADQDLN